MMVPKGAGATRAQGGGPAGEGGAGGGGGPLNTIMDTLSNFGGGLLDLGKSAYRGVVKGAKFIGRGISSSYNKLKDVMGFGKPAAKIESDIVEEAGKFRSKSTGKFVSKAEAEAAGVLKDTSKLEAKGAKVAEKALATAGEDAGKAAAKKGLIKTIVGKVIGPKLAKAAVKSIPLVGALAGLGFAINRAMAGDYYGAGAEVASGIASTVPGVGTAASVLADMGLLARDIYEAVYGVLPEKDPEVGTRMQEIQEEIENFLKSNSGGDVTTPPPQTKPLSGVSSFETMAAAGPAAPLKAQITAEEVPMDMGEGVVGSSYQAKTSFSPLINTKNIAMAAQSGWNAMASSGPPVIINNMAAPQVSQGGGGGNNNTRLTGAVSTAPVPSLADRTINHRAYYGAGYP